eukprot:jgi/Phyca11/118307/e_gw1.35.152.1
MYGKHEYDSHSATLGTPTRERSTPSRQRGINKRAGSTPNQSTSNKKPKTESEAMDVLLTLVGRIAATREAELARSKEQDKETAVRVRCEHYKMLDDFRNRVSKIECEMSSAATPIKMVLQEYLNFFLEERQRIMDALHSQGL